MTIKKRKSETMQFLENLAGGPLTMGGLIRSVRLCEEMSQTDFAKKLKITTSHLCDIEKGRKTVSPERAARFATILGRSEEQFVGLAIQDILTQSGLKMKIHVEAA